MVDGIVNLLSARVFTVQSYFSRTPDYPARASARIPDCAACIHARSKRGCLPVTPRVAERRDHGVGAALEDPAASGDKKSVARKDRLQRRKIIGDMAVGMGGNADYAGAQAGELAVSPSSRGSVSAGIRPSSARAPNTRIPGTARTRSSLPPTWSACQWSRGRRRASARAALTASRTLPASAQSITPTSLEPSTNQVGIIILQLGDWNDSHRSIPPRG